jgi:hypothetical protein
VVLAQQQVQVLLGRIVQEQEEEVGIFVAEEARSVVS